MNLSQQTHRHPVSKSASESVSEATARFRLSTISVLRFDAAVSVLSGLVVVLAAGPLSRELDLSDGSVLRAIGIVLLLYGLAMALSSTRSDAVVHETALVTALTDLVWVCASVVVAVTVDVPAWGVAVVVVQAAAVLGIGLTKFHVLGR